MPLSCHLRNGPAGRRQASETRINNGCDTAAPAHSLARISLANLLIVFKYMTLIIKSPFGEGCGGAAGV
jgi:hypothetical protein